MHHARVTFVSANAPDTQAEDYASIKDSVLCASPNDAKRIYSISFMHDGTQWNATLGERLSGSRRIERSAKREPQRFERVLDSAIIRSIFAPNKNYTNGPFVVVTDQGVSVGERSKWANPFFAQPDEIVCFPE